MKNNQTIKKVMIKTINLQHLSILALVASLSACSLSKPGDKDRSSMLNGEGSFQTISIKKKDPNSSTNTKSPGNDEEDAAALASASFSSGESIALGTFVSKIAEECGEDPFLKNIAHISGDLGLNLPPIRALLADAQKDKKEEDKYSFEVLADAIFGEDVAKELAAGKGEPIVQWVNYCQKSEDDPTIHGWITDNTLKAQKTAYAPPMNPLFQHTPSLSLAWVQHHFVNTILDIKPALADTNVDLSSLKVAVYPLINSSIKDSQITARYETTVGGDKLPDSLKLKYSSLASAVADGFNNSDKENPTPENEKLVFPAEQFVIPVGQKTELNGVNEVKFSTSSEGVSDIYVKVNVLRADGTPDIQNFFTWVQHHLEQNTSISENQRALLLNTGTSKVVVPSQEDILSMAENASAAEDLGSGGTSSEPETTTAPDDNTTRSLSPEPNKTAARTSAAPKKETFFNLPSWIQEDTSGSVVPEETPVVVVNKSKASPDASFNPFDGTDLECPEDYNLLSLNISCTDCLGPDLVAFEWSPEQLRAKNQKLEDNDYYRLLNKTFGDNSAKTLLQSKAGAQHTLNLCFNDESYKGSFTDQNFQETASSAFMFFENNEEQAIVVEDHAGQKHLVIEVGYKAYYTAFPEVVTNLTTITGQTLLGNLDQHTLFFQPNAEGTHYSYTPNSAMGPQIPVDQKKYARAQKVLKFMIPLNDLANLHAAIDDTVQVKIGAKNVAHRKYPPSPLLSAFDKLDYLITGDMSVASVRYARHDIDIFKALGAKIIASAVVPDVNQDDTDNSIDIANFEANMRRGSEEVETDHPGDYFKQSPSMDSRLLAQKKKENPMFGTTVLSKTSMIEQCNNYAYRFGVSLKGRYTLVDTFENTEQKLIDLSKTVPNVGKLLNDLVLVPIRNIANNTKRTTWNVYICSNTLDTGILSNNDYVAFLDTLPTASDDIAGVFKISNPHSNIVIESNAKKNTLLVGLDIVSFDIHDGDRVGSYLDLPKIVVGTIKNKPPTRINFQFTGEFSLDHRDITAASKQINTRFHFADTVRRLRFEPSLDPITNTFEVVTEVRDTEPAVVIKDPVILHKNSLKYQGNQTFPGTGVDVNKSFDGFLQTYGEFNAFQFGFWLDES